MSHAFNTSILNFGKPAFGTYTKKQNYTDYLENMKGINLYNNTCTNNKKYKSQSEMLLYNKINYKQKCINVCGNELPFNKGDLEINLITKEDLNGFVIIQSKTGNGPTTVNPALTPFYAYYTLDPSNVLIGDTPCAVSKYINYMVLNTVATDNYLPPSQDAGC